MTMAHVNAGRQGTRAAAAKSGESPVRLRQVPVYWTEEISPDPMDRARQLDEERLWLASLHRSLAEQQQRDIAQTLREQGRYGWCLDCGQAIPALRLRANPDALRCVGCQAAHEARAEQGSPRGARRSDTPD